MGNLVAYPSELGQDSGKPERRFDLLDDGPYSTWKTAKLAGYPEDTDQIRIEIEDLGAPGTEEQAQITGLINKTNIAVYKTSAQDNELRAKLASFATGFGLCRCETHRSAEEDGLVPIEVVAEGGRHGFIPYTDKPLSWHTDGYYNDAKNRIRAILMHCVRPAAEGGVNYLLDPEIAYIRLRDENPDFIKALSNRRAMTIPGFTDADGTFREERTGPVFSVDRFTGALQMRYTARKRNIVWRNDAVTKDALSFLTEVMENDPLVFEVELSAGEGVICNNVLHNRTAFTDHTEPGQTRLLYRARYMDRILGT